MSLRTDVSLSAIVAGFVTVLVGFTPSAVIVFQAARGGREPSADQRLDLGAGHRHGRDITQHRLGILGIACGRSRVVDFTLAAGWVGIARRRASIGSWQGRCETPQRYWLVAHAPNVILSVAKDLLLVFCSLRKADPSLRSG